MPENKYELKSNDLHELMRKTPHLFIIWGNLFVFTFLIASLAVLNHFPIRETKTIPFRIIGIIPASPGNGDLLLALGIQDIGDISVNQTLSLRINLENKMETYDAEIKRIVVRKSYESVIYAVAKTNSKLMLKKELIGTAQVNIKTTTLISDLIDKAF